MTSLVRAMTVGLALVIAGVAPACGGGTDEVTEDATASQGRFETFVGEDGQHYFQLVAANGERVLRSEGYVSLSNAKKGIASVRNNARTPDGFEILESDGGDAYFNVVAGNGQVVATSETYASASNATRAVDTTIRIVATAIDATAATGAARFETFTGQDGQTYFRLRAKNGEIVLQSEGYSSKSAAEGGIDSVEANGVDATRYELVEGADDQYGFRIVALNGEIVARGEMYASKSNALRGAETVRDILRELTGDGEATDAEIQVEVERAADGLTYMSESDYPYLWVHADTGGSAPAIDEAFVRQAFAAYVDEDPDADKPMADLYAMEGTWEEWKSSEHGCSGETDPESVDYCFRSRTFEQVLESNLEDVRVFYFGAYGEPGSVDGVAVSIFIVGRTPSGNVAGVRTIAIWT